MTDNNGQPLATNPFRDARVRRGLTHDPRMDERTIAIGVRPAR